MWLLLAVLLRCMMFAASYNATWLSTPIPINLYNNTTNDKISNKSANDMMYVSEVIFDSFFLGPS